MIRACRRSPAADSLTLPGVMAIGRPHVAIIAGPGVHLDLGKAGTQSRGSSLFRWLPGGMHRPIMWMEPLLALASSANVTFFLASSVEEITPSRICSFAASTFSVSDARLSSSLRSLSAALHRAPPCSCVVRPLFQPGDAGVSVRVAPDQPDVIQVRVAQNFRDLHGHRGAVVGAAVRLAVVHDDVAFVIDLQFDDRTRETCAALPPQSDGLPPAPPRAWTRPNRSQARLPGSPRGRRGAGTSPIRTRA